MEHSPKSTATPQTALGVPHRLLAQAHPQAPAGAAQAKMGAILRGAKNEPEDTSWHEANTASGTAWSKAIPSVHAHNEPTRAARQASKADPAMATAPQAIHPPPLDAAPGTG